MTAKGDWKTIRDALRRLRAYGQMWKWGSDFGWCDIELAEEGLRALERRRDGVHRQLEFWGRAVEEIVQEVERGAAPE